ncbi:regulatory protein, Fis family [Desulfacinum hydrothermale DSM 13146]|uniref:Regulatory protein, Fis family n=1 Tax=Desulfacinum hydrothermale DSM 13146 TaxID=1121390 RepID=A0A1W1X9Q1_9BACT|nr:sigma-54 dependent transcriptional regulator [Desulfacinum hydrothermale]SMC20583.1 regulatory protein, Fis family [Desulfacinum hydrothermale DSM 13146]
MSNVHKARLLIVDDEEDMLTGLQRLLGYEMPHVTVETTCRPSEAVAQVDAELYDVVLLDIRMPEMDGLEVLQALRQKDPWLTVVMMTAYGTIEVAVEAIKKGAYDFVTKPFDRQALIRVLEKAIERNRLIRENLNLRRRAEEKPPLGQFVGQSVPMRRLYERFQAVARTDYAVLIRGESGTGKELVAQAVHSLSRRRRRPLISINCPAIPEHLLESELFGHKKGAFTGADRDHRGIFEEAHGGTLFLDEIADIPVSVQTKLLRALQEGEIRPLGDVKAKQVDVRILSSTNQDLEQKIRERTFREDLFYRLNVVTIQTPALRQIREDIPLLATHFVRMACDEMGVAMKRFSENALEALMERDWPGNIRQLQNVVRQAVMFSPEDVIRYEDLRRLDAASEGCHGQRTDALEPDDGRFMPYKDAKERVVEKFTVRYVRDVLERTEGNVSRAAEMSGLTRAALQKIMRRYGIRSEDYRALSSHSRA